jgi:hypothetical protein
MTRPQTNPLPTLLPARHKTSVLEFIPLLRMMAIMDDLGDFFNSFTYPGSLHVTSGRSAPIWKSSTTK